MARNLHTAHKYQVQYTSTVIAGSDSQEVLDMIFCEFEISTNKDDEYDDEYDVARSELSRLVKIIKDEQESDYYKEREEFLMEQLGNMQLTLDEFIAALIKLINTSDQSNDDVLLS